LKLSGNSILRLFFERKPFDVSVEFRTGREGR
jgi:hypothetical protein